MSDGGKNKKQLGQILLQRRLISANQLQELVSKSKLSQERIASVAENEGLVSADDLLQSLSEQQGLPAVDIDRKSIDLRVLEIVPEIVAQKRLVLPLERTDAVVFVAMADPNLKNIVHEIEFITGLQVFPYVALHRVLEETIKEAYLLAKRGERFFFGSRVPLSEREEKAATGRSVPPMPGDGATFSFPPLAEQFVPADTAKAIGDTALHKALSEPPPKPNPFLERAIAAYSKDALVEAVSELQEAIAHDPESQQAFYYLGLIYGRNNKLHEGTKVLEKAVELDPTHFDCLKSLAILYHQIGYFADAIATWKRALPHAPDAATHTKIQEYLARAVQAGSN